MDTMVARNERDSAKVQERDVEEFKDTQRFLNEKKPTCFARTRSQKWSKPPQKREIERRSESAIPAPISSLNIRASRWLRRHCRRDL